MKNNDDREGLAQYIDWTVRPCFGTFDSFLAGLVRAKLECALHVSVSKHPINQFKPVEQKTTRAYCPNVYTVETGFDVIFKGFCCDYVSSSSIRGVFHRKKGGWLLLVVDAKCTYC